VWVVLTLSVAAVDMDNVYGEMLNMSGVEVVGITSIHETKCLAILRKGRMKKVSFESVAVDDIYAINLAGKGALAGQLIIKFVRAFMKVGRLTKQNFRVKEFQEVALKDVVEEMRPLTLEQRQEVYGECKHIVKKMRTKRECYLACQDTQIEKILKGDSEAMLVIKKDAYAQDIIELKEFTYPSQIMCTTFNVYNGELIQFSVKDYLEKGWYLEYTLVLSGPAGALTYTIDLFCRF